MITRIATQTVKYRVGKDLSGPRQKIGIEITEVGDCKQDMVESAVCPAGCDPVNVQFGKELGIFLHGRRHVAAAGDMIADGFDRLPEAAAVNLRPIWRRPSGSGSFDLTSIASC